jgi:hypothetical protein
MVGTQLAEMGIVFGMSTRIAALRLPARWHSSSIGGATERNPPLGIDLCLLLETIRIVPTSRSGVRRPIDGR